MRRLIWLEIQLRIFLMGCISKNVVYFVLLDQGNSGFTCNFEYFSDRIGFFEKEQSV